MAYRPNIKNADGSLKDLPLEAETTVKLKTPRSIGLSGVSANAQNFDGTGNISIPVTAVPATLLTGTANISTTGNAATATNATNATNSTNANNYSSSGSIQTKFNAVDSSLANIGKVQIGSTLYQVRTTTTTTDPGVSGYITFIL